MKPEINIDWKKKAKQLEKKMGIRDAAYKCNVAEYTFKRIMSGDTKRMDYECGILILYYLEGAE
jgi:hypothetical protein